MVELAVGAYLLYLMERNPHDTKYTLADGSGNINNLFNNYNEGVFAEPVGNVILSQPLPLADVYDYRMKNMYRQDLPLQVPSRLRQNNNGGNTWIVN